MSQHYSDPSRENARRRIAYREMASLLMARKNCLADPAKADRAEKHTQVLLTLVDNVMPSGAGFDNGTTLDLDKSNGDRLVFTTAYHHMNGGGYYNGWTEHTVTVTPSLLNGIVLRVSGRDRNDIKDYIYECFDSALQELVVWHIPTASYVLDRMADLVNRTAIAE